MNGLIGAAEQHQSAREPALEGSFADSFRAGRMEPRRHSVRDEPTASVLLALYFLSLGVCAGTGGSQHFYSAISRGWLWPAGGDGAGANS